MKAVLWTLTVLGGLMAIALVLGLLSVGSTPTSKPKAVAPKPMTPLQFQAIEKGEPQAVVSTLFPQVSTAAGSTTIVRAAAGGVYVLYWTDGCDSEGSICRRVVDRKSYYEAEHGNFGGKKK